MPLKTTRFGQRLRAWRRRQKLYQKEAAAILEVSERSYQSWEYGEVQPAKHGRRWIYALIEKHEGKK